MDAILDKANVAAALLGYSKVSYAKLALLTTTPDGKAYYLISRLTLPKHGW